MLLILNHIPRLIIDRHRSIIILIVEFNLFNFESLDSISNIKNMAGFLQAETRAIFYRLARRKQEAAFLPLRAGYDLGLRSTAFSRKANSTRQHLMSLARSIDLSSRLLVIAAGKLLMSSEQKEVWEAAFSLSCPSHSRSHRICQLNRAWDNRGVSLAIRSCF